MPSPARVRWAKFRATAVSSVALAILAVLFYLLTGGTLLEQKAAIHMYIPDAAGLGPESPVRVNGIDVGQVEKISFSGSNDPQRVVRVEMVLTMQNLGAIPADSVAEISTDTLIGDKFVDITSGRSPSVMRPGGELAVKPPSDVLKSIDMQQLEANLREVEKTLTGIEQGTNRVGQFIKGENIYRNILQRLQEVDRKVREASSATGQIGQFVYGDTLYRRIREPIAQLDASLAKLQSGQDDLGRFLRDPAQYEKWRNDTREISRQVEEVAAMPFLRSEAGYEGMVHTADSLLQAVDEFNTSPLMRNSSVYDNLTGLSKEFGALMKDFRENPKKYMWFKVF